MTESMIPKKDIGSGEPLRFLVFAASLRSTSINAQLAHLAAGIITKYGGVVNLSSMTDFDCPSYDQDLLDAQGFPPGALAFKSSLEASDAFVIASPEYNFSIPGVLKNSIDWVSRFRPQPFNGRHALLMSASPSMVGGNRGLWALRIPLEQLGTRVFPDMFSLAQANKSMDAEGGIADPQLSQRFEATIKAFIDLVEAAKHYPAAKKAWIEFLGERAESTSMRSE